MFKRLCKSDLGVQHEVITEIELDPKVSAADVSVSVHKGIVTLRGHVSHNLEKHAAELAAQRIKGVRAVANELEVKILKFYERTDADIARMALAALEWNYNVPDEIKVAVEKGWITVGGEAIWEFEKKAATDAVSSLMGVRGVSNDILLKNSSVARLAHRNLPAKYIKGWLKIKDQENKKHVL